MLLKFSREKSGPRFIILNILILFFLSGCAHQAKRQEAVQVKPTNGHALHDAVTANDLEETIRLVDLGFNPQAKDVFGFTPFSISVFYGYTEIASYLIEKGVIISYRDKDGWTPLNIAIANGNSDIVKLLLDHGVDTTLTDIYGDTPLEYAIKCRQKEIVDLLREHGAK